MASKVRQGKVFDPYHLYPHFIEQVARPHYQNSTSPSRKWNKEMQITKKIRDDPHAIRAFVELDIISLQSPRASTLNRKSGV